MSTLQEKEATHYKKFFLKVLFLAALLYVPFYLLSRKYDKTMWLLKKEKAHWVLSQKNKNYDIAFVGSSRVFNCIDTHVIDSALNSNSINLGVGGASYSDNYLLLYNFLKNNTVKNICIQVDFWGLIPGKQAYSCPFSEEKYLHLLGDPVVDSIYRENTNYLKLPFRKYLPYFKYSEYNNIYPLDLMSGLCLYKGMPLEPISSGGSKIPEQPKQGFSFHLKDTLLNNFQFSHNSIESLTHLIHFASKKCERVYLFTTPSFAPFMKKVALYRNALDTIKKIEASVNLPYFNHERDTICSDSLFFRDFTHLNRKGATYFSLELANDLKKQINE